MHFSKCLAGISGGVGIFIIYQGMHLERSGEGSWRCRLLWPPGVTLPFNDCTTIARPHPEGPGSCSNFLCPQTLRSPDVSYMFQNVRGWSLSPSASHLPRLRPHPSAGHLFGQSLPSRRLFLLPSRQSVAVGLYHYSLQPATG